MRRRVVLEGVTLGALPVTAAQYVVEFQAAAGSGAGSNGTAGSGLMRALEKSARAKGVEILLDHKMTRIVRERHRWTP